MSKNAATTAAVQEMQTTQTYSGFESSVLEAAQEQADRIVAKTKEECDAAFAAALAQYTGDPVEAHRTHNEAALRRKIAGEKQGNLQKLLIYRKQLVNGLFAEAQEELQAFAETEAYKAYLQGTLAPYQNKAAQGCMVLVRKADLVHEKAITALLPNAKCAEDSTILLGGAKVVIGRVLYDETLDERLSAQRAEFLTRCNLHVASQQEEE